MARDFVKDTQEVRNFNEELNKSTDTLKEVVKLAGRDLTSALVKVSMAHQDSNKYSKENVDLAKEESKVGKTILGVLNAQNSGSKANIIVAKARLKWTQMWSDKENETTQELFNQYDITQKINKEKAKEDKITNKLKMNFKDIKDSLEGTLPFGRQLFKVFDTTLGTGKRIGAVLGIFGALAAGAMKKFADLTKVIGENFGAIGMTTPEIKDGLLGASVEATRLGFGMSDVASVVNELTNNFGFSLEESIKLSSSILDTSRALGMSVSEGTQLIGTLSQVVGLSTEASTQFAKQTTLLAKQSGVAPNIVMKDIAASAEIASKFFSEGGENIGKAAIMATKLGTNLGTVGKIAEGLLDFQSSISKEIEASVMLGKDLNFQKARELALNNDIEGAMAEIVGQLGTEEEFNKLNALERQALADSINVSTSELAKFVANQDKALTLTESIAAQPGFEDLIGRDAIDNITKITNDFATIGATLITSVGPTLSTIVGSIANFSKWISESKVGLGIMAGVATSLAAALMISAVAAIGTTLGMTGIGIALIPGVIAGFMAMASSAKAIPKAHDLELGKVASVTSGELLTDASEATVKKESLSDMNKGMEKRLDTITMELTKLNSIMVTNPNKTGRATGDAITSGIK